MNIFTYKDYIKCIHTLRLNAAFKLAEESSKYYIDKEDKKDTRIIKKILNRRKEMEIFINEFLDLNEKIESKNLTKYNNEYICNKYRIDKNKLIYKVKNKEIFFLVEEISELDNIVLYEILNYCISIMQEWNLSNKIRCENKYPIIIPIIIYTGDKKRILIENKEDRVRIENNIFKNYNILLNYNLININKIHVEKLLASKSLITYGILIKKSKNEIELKKNLNLIIDNIENDFSLDYLRVLTNYLSSEDRAYIIDIIKSKKDRNYK